MKSDSITPGEMVRLHEILTFKNTCAVKASAMGAAVNDQRLSMLLEQDVAVAKQQLQDLKNVLTHTNAID